MSVASPVRPTLSPLTSWVLSACERASRFGIYLLPLFYVAFFAALFLLWREPQATFWPIATAGALGWAMMIWALVFGLAGRQHAPASGHAIGHGAQAAARSAPLRFASVPTRACRETCAMPGADMGRFSAACFHMHCTDVPSMARSCADASGLHRCGNH